MRRNRRGLNRSTRERGFSLVEIMAVVVIIGILATTVTVGINSRVKKARLEATKTQISSLEQAVSMFHLECGFFPESIVSLIQPPSSGRNCKGYPPEGFLGKKALPDDPWGLPYNYVRPGTHNAESYDLWSVGPDGEDGTSDDVTNWESEEDEE